MYTIDDLKRMANNMHNWRDRLCAVRVLSNWDCQQSRDILVRLAIHDPVFCVKEAAFRAAQAMGCTKNGQPIRLTKMPKGNLVKNINKILVEVRDSLNPGFSLQEFKFAFQNYDPATYDIYDGNKGNHLDEWLSNVIPNLPKTM